MHPQCLMELLLKPVQSKAKQCFPLRKAFSDVFIFFFQCENGIQFWKNCGCSRIHTNLFSSSRPWQLLVASSSWFSSVVFQGSLEQRLLSYKLQTVLPTVLCTDFTRSCLRGLPYWTEKLRVVEIPLTFDLKFRLRGSFCDDIADHKHRKPHFRGINTQTHHYSLMSTLPAGYPLSKCSVMNSLTPTFPSRVLRPLSSPFLCLEVELPLVLWLPSFPLPVPLDKDVEDWLTVLFRLGCSALGVRWRPDRDGEGTGSSFFSEDLLDLVGYIQKRNERHICR